MARKIWEERRQDQKQYQSTHSETGSNRRITSLSLSTDHAQRRTSRRRINGLTKFRWDQCRWPLEGRSWRGGYADRGRVADEGSPQWTTIPGADN